MKKTEEKNERISFFVTPEIKQTAERLAANKRVSLSAVLREALETGLSLEKVTNETEIIKSAMRDVTTETMQPYFERMMKVIAKGSALSASNYFLFALMFEEILNEPRSAKQMLNESRKLAYSYLRQKDTSVDDFIKNTDEITRRLDDDTKGY